MEPYSTEKTPYVKTIAVNERRWLLRIGFSSSVAVGFF